MPELEARITGERVALDGMKFPTHVAPSASSANTIDMAGLNVSNAVKQLPALFAAEVEKIKGRLAQSSRLYHGLRSALHNYATDVHIALTLGDAAETIFEQARARVDVFVRAHCPEAAEKLLAINDRLNDADKESLTQALTSCRRLLGAVADAVYPPRAEPHVDSKGTKRKVGKEEYKNRILAFVEERVARGSTKALLESELEHLVARVDSAYEKACKGVHADVSMDETRLAILQTYILLGEVARLMPGPSKSGKGQR